MFSALHLVIVAIIALIAGGVVGWLSRRPSLPPVVAAEPRQDARIDKLTAQVEKLRAACLLSTEQVGKRPADAAARLVRSFGGADGAVVAGPEGLSMSSKESELERMLAAVVPASLGLWRHLDATGVVHEATVLTRKGMGVRIRPLGVDGRSLVIAGRGGMPSALLSRAAFADGGGDAAAGKPAVMNQQVDFGVVPELQRSVERMDIRSLFLVTDEVMAVAMSRRGLSFDALRTLYQQFRAVQRQLSIVLGEEVERIELSGELRVTFARGDLGWWGQIHADHVLEDLALRRLEGALRAAGKTMVA